MPVLAFGPLVEPPKDFVEELRAINRFQFQSPVNQQALLIDRRKELAEAVVACRQYAGGVPGGILVIGGRGIGKTSFLIALSNAMQSKDSVSCRFQLDPMMTESGNELLLFKTILRELSAACTDADLLNQGLGRSLVSALTSKMGLDEVRVEFPYLSLIASKDKHTELGQFPYIVLRDGLKELLSKVAQSRKNLILCIDEGDMLASNTALLHIIRNVFQELTGVVLVIAGTGKLLEGVSPVFTPFPRFFKKIELGPYLDLATTKEAIDTPLGMMKTEISEKLDLAVDFHLDTFRENIDEITDRMPLDVNLLCHLAYDRAVRNMSQDGRLVRMWLKLDDDVMKSAMKQLRGTKDYQSFLSELDEPENSLLRIISQVTQRAGVDELTLLMLLDEFGSSLQTESVDNIIEAFDRLRENRQKLFETIESIRSKAEPHQIHAFRKAFGTPTGFSLDDQWLRAYFKYSVPRVHVNLEEFRRIPFKGIHVFGDPITTVIHSVFFPRLGRAITRKAEFRAHTGYGPGKSIGFQKDRQLLLSYYRRNADGQMYHVGFLVRQEEDLAEWLEEIPRVLAALRRHHLVGEYKVETVRNVASPVRRFKGRPLR